MPLGSTWRRWVTGRASVKLACLWLSVCVCVRVYTRGIPAGKALFPKAEAVIFLF